MNRRNVARQIVAKLIADMTDRRGLRQEWEEIDEEIQREIRNKWITIVLEELPK